MSDLPDEARAAFDEDARELRAMFVASREADLDRLAVAIVARDFPTVHAVGHVFRGSGATFGFPETSRLGALLEDAAARQDVDAASVLAASLRACLQAAP